MNNRIYVWALMACFTFSLASCGSDDNDEPTVYSQEDYNNPNFFVDMLAANTVRIGEERFNIDELMHDVMENGKSHMPSGYEIMIPDSDETDFYVYDEFPAEKTYSLAELEGLWFPVRVVNEEDVETFLIFYINNGFMCTYAFARVENRWYNVNGDVTGDSVGITLSNTSRIEVKENNGFYSVFNSQELKMHIVYADKASHTVIFADHKVDTPDADLSQVGVPLDASYASDFWSVYTQF